MNKWQKIGLGVLGVSWTAQFISNLMLLKRCEEMEEKYESVHKAGRYLISVLERENVPMTEFDRLALEALLLNPPKVQGE